MHYGSRRLEAFFEACLLLLFVGLETPQASANAINITTNVEGDAIQWTATWDPMQNGNGVDLFVSQDGFSLTKNVTFVNTTPITVTFSESAVAAVDSAEGGGLRSPVDQILKNRTTVDWSGFKESLLNNTPVCDNAAANTDVRCAVTTQGRTPPTRDVGTGAHPQFPHFHNPTGMMTLPPFTQLAEGGDKKSLFRSTVGVGDTPVPKKTGAWTPTGIVIHDIEVQGFRRTFTLIEQPIPVPQPEPLPPPKEMNKGDSNGGSLSYDASLQTLSFNGDRMVHTGFPGDPILNANINIPALHLISQLNNGSFIFQPDLNAIFDISQDGEEFLSAHMPYLTYLPGNNSFFGELTDFAFFSFGSPWIAEMASLFDPSSPSFDPNLDLWFTFSPTDNFFDLTQGFSQNAITAGADAIFAAAQAVPEPPSTLFLIFGLWMGWLVWRRSSGASD